MGERNIGAGRVHGGFIVTRRFAEPRWSAIFLSHVFPSTSFPPLTIPYPHLTDPSCLQTITSLYILSDSRAMRKWRILFGFGPNSLPDKGLQNFARSFMT